MKFLDLNTDRPLVMGIMNITPDSFSDGGLFRSIAEVEDRAYQLKLEGADILDIGAESTRPNAPSVSVEEELDRLYPVLESLSKMDIPLSVDTYKPKVMKLALNYKVTMINDINALQSEDALNIIQNYHHDNTLICLMHKQGNPETMQQQPHYENLIQEVHDFLEERIQAVESIGLSRDRVVIDLGFGFGKTLEHNCELFKHIPAFESLKSKMLVGISRKSMLGAITGNPVHFRTYESVIGAILAIQKGAKIVRVHDVKATVDALKTYQALI